MVTPRVPESRTLILAIGLFFATFSQPVWAADCPETFTALQLEDQLGAAETALASLDLSLFKSNLDSAERMVPCLSERAVPSLAASYHRFYGLRAVGDRDPIADKAFAAAKFIEPNYSFSTSLIPVGNPIRKIYDEVSIENRATESIEAPNGGSIYMDGTRSLKRPTEWPVFVQWVQNDTVHFSRYLLPGNPIPTYDLASDVVIPKREPSIPLVAVSGGAAVLSGALYTVALINQGRYKQVGPNSVPDKDLPGLRRTTNSLVVVSGISAAAAVGTGVAVVATW